MGAQPATAVGALAREVGCDVVQLHADPDAAAVDAVRAAWRGAVWAVLRVAGTTLPAHAPSLFAAADAVVLDARVDGALGGTGVALDWEALADAVGAARGATPLVLAGGLRAGNVARAVRALRPDVVDVSSGVERAPGEKDAAAMSAFAAAVAGAADAVVAGTPAPHAALMR